MSKKERTPHKKSIIEPEDFLKPIDITQFGNEDDPCFGKLYNLSDMACKRCGDSSLCGLVFGQNLNVTRKKIEKDSRFKDLEKPDEISNPALYNWVKSKKEDGLTRSEIIKRAKSVYGSSREEIKKIYNSL